MTSIVLTTLNARFIHSALGLRYLKANMGSLYDNTEIVEFTINQRPVDIAESLLKKDPIIIGFSVYIWNTTETIAVIKTLRAIAPEITIIVGGPEVSHEIETQPYPEIADYIVQGMADLSFAQLCQQLVDGSPPDSNIIFAPPFDPLKVKLPYDEYTDEDIAHRVIYVEASRGCPFRCQFCLSALDKTVWSFELDEFLAAMERLYQRGVRHFKFVDRTFNLKVSTSKRILQFFLDRISDDLFLHFELIPDHLPNGLREMIAKFPPHALQFEIGIQSFNPEVQALIERKQDDDKSADNMHWLKELGTVHTHADLIIGLPGEDMASFAKGFNKMVALTPDEIQVGILKRLRGSPIIQHTERYQLRFSPLPPYDILATRDIDFATMRRLSRFARYWDQIANSGRFKNVLSLLLGDHPFENFLTLSDWLFEVTAQTHRINLDRMFAMIHRWASLQHHIDSRLIEHNLLIDFNHSGIKGHPSWLKQSKLSTQNSRNTRSRQKRHQTQ